MAIHLARYLTRRFAVQLLLLAGVAICVNSIAVAQSSGGGALGDFTDGGACQPSFIEAPIDLPRLAVESGSESALAAAPASATAPIELQADVIEVDSARIVTLLGNARLVHGARQATAKRMIYHTDTQQVSATGEVVFYSAHGDSLHAERLEWSADTGVGEGSAIEMQIARRDAPVDASGRAQHRATATAQRILLQGEQSQRLRQVTMTTCAPGNQDVLLRAKEIHLDHANGIGTAKAMTLTFKKIPLFYFPSLTFPLNNRRKTGFLFPEFGYADESGWIVETPYYLNLAPHYDATLTARILSQRGGQLFGKFRYLGEHSRGTLRGEWLPADAKLDDQHRYAFAYQHQHQFGDRWHFALDWNRISDAAYLRDFSNEVDIAAASYVEQRAAVDYFGDNVRIQARAIAYDSANGSVNPTNRPHEILPQVRVTLKPRRWSFLELAAHAEYSNFQHPNRSAPSGTRLRFTPSLSVPLEQAYGYLKPKIAWQSIRYSLRNTTSTAASSSSPSLSAPVFSVDSGLFFERQIFTQAAKRKPNARRDYSHTLEPRLFYLNIPRRAKQNRLQFPNFDTSRIRYHSFAQLFRETRFFGGDRIGDTEQISVGLSSRIIANHSGVQRFALHLGEVFYLKPRRIGLTPNAPIERADTSGLLAEATAALSQSWRVTGFARWHQNSRELDSFRLSTEYNNAPNRSAKFGYVFHDTPLISTHDSAPTKQLSLAFQTPLRPQWQLQFDADYSLAADQINTAALRFNFDGCCWAAQFGAQRYLDGEGAHKNRFTATLQLDGLGRLGAGR